MIDSFQPDFGQRFQFKRSVSGVIRKAGFYLHTMNGSALLNAVCVSQSAVFQFIQRRSLSRSWSNNCTCFQDHKH